MSTRWILVFLGFYGTVLLVGCEADEGQTPSPVTESIEPFSTDPNADRPSARVLERYGIFFPDGVKHSIPMNEIHDGGPGIDGIALDPTLDGKADVIDGVSIVLIASPDSDAVRVYKRKNYQFEGTFEQVRDSRSQTVWKLSDEMLLNPKTGESLERVPDVFVSNAGAWARFFPDTLIYHKP